MRNGTCNNLINSTNNLTTYDFECKCQFPYYGRYCHLITDLCWNITCSQQGGCFMNGSTTYCQCYSSFSGLNCEIVSEALQTARLISNISGFAAIGMICCFLGAIVFLDLFDLFIWLFDKPKTKIKKKIKKPPIKKVEPPKKILTYTDYVDFPE
jgi:hypothetical protein